MQEEVGLQSATDGEFRLIVETAQEIWG